MPSAGSGPRRRRGAPTGLDKQTQQLINAARTLGTLYLEDVHLIRLCAVVGFDLGRDDLVNDIASGEELSSGYYGTPLTWFAQEVPAGVSLPAVFQRLADTITDFPTYFNGLCELHKRRLKFELILENQPLPQMEQIAPRCLLEYGLRPTDVLASWLVWRKWLYDVDNRSAQETGYLFEPILAAALGGIPYSASRSPIKRADAPTKGRQVDCVNGRLAYEFKMRVTIAASGQGRFREELDFARDCHASGYTPILLVLDPTPSARLTDLAAEYQKHGGEAFVGDEAWGHLEKNAGSVMGSFIERYVRVPLKDADEAYTILQPIRLAYSPSEVSVEVGGSSFLIVRPRGALALPELEALISGDEPAPNED